MINFREKLWTCEDQGKEQGHRCLHQQLQYHALPLQPFPTNKTINCGWLSLIS
jgi:hypothetical protein